ncbi:MAG: type II CAAX prenyl endopeptidase Rce1 family protein [Acidobacteriota bacterium]
MRRILIVAVAVLLSTATAVLYEVVIDGVALRSLPAIVGVFLAAFSITSYFAVWTASSLGLPTFLLLSPLPSRHKWTRFAVYGVGVGIAISLVNSALYHTAASTPVRPWYADNLDSHLDMLLLSARAGLLEETFYRLFAIPFLVSLGMRFYGWRPRFGFEPARGEPSPPAPRPSKLMIAGAVILSALLFGFAHRFNPAPAVAFGLILGLVYLKAGWESAVVAHFLGDYLLFAGIYL